MSRPSVLNLCALLAPFMMAIGFALTPASAAGTSGGTTSSEGAPVSLSGEVIDTWCHFSGVMGAGEAVQGTAHHTCALWCAAGGIPVGVLADDGTVYTLLKWKDQDPLTKTEAILDVQSNRISVTGALHQRDGINYLIVEEVTANEGIVNKTHEIFGVTPHFAIPEPDQK